MNYLEIILITQRRRGFSTKRQWVKICLWLRTCQLQRWICQLLISTTKKKSHELYHNIKIVC